MVVWFAVLWADHIHVLGPDCWIHWSLSCCRLRCCCCLSASVCVTMCLSTMCVTMCVNNVCQQRVRVTVDMCCSPLHDHKRPLPLLMLVGFCVPFHCFLLHEFAVLLVHCKPHACCCPRGSFAACATPCSCAACWWVCCRLCCWWVAVCPCALAGSRCCSAPSRQQRACRTAWGIW